MEVPRLGHDIRELMEAQEGPSDRSLAPRIIAGRGKTGGTSDPGTAASCWGFYRDSARILECKGLFPRCSYSSSTPHCLPPPQHKLCGGGNGCGDSVHTPAL